MKNFILIIAGLFLFLSSSAQKLADSLNNNNKNIRYFLMLEMGGMLGKNNGISNAVQVDYTSAITQGVRIGNRLGVGAGVGFDSYPYWKTVPFFGSVLYDLFGNQNNRVFVRLNYGYAYIWLEPANQYYGYKGSKGDKVFSPSIGYRTSVSNWKIYLTAGYKFQRTVATSTYQYYNCPSCDYFAPNSNGSSTQMRTDMNRFIFTMGLGWR